MNFFLKNNHTAKLSHCKTCPNDENKLLSIAVDCGLMSDIAKHKLLFTGVPVYILHPYCKLDSIISAIDYILNDFICLKFTLFIYTYTYIYNYSYQIIQVRDFYL